MRCDQPLPDVAVPAAYCAIRTRAFGAEVISCVDGAGVPLDRNVNPQCHCVDTDWEKYPVCKTTRDGSYDPATDLLRSGQRMEANATLFRRASF